MSTKTVKEIIAEAFIGKRVRFPGLSQQFQREEIHTIEKVHFSADDCEAEEEDCAVGVCFTTSKAPGFGGATSAWVYYDLTGHVEFVTEPPPAATSEVG